MINSLVELRFYIKADSIMNGFNNDFWLKRVINLNKRAQFLRTLRICEFLGHKKETHKWMLFFYLFYALRYHKLSYLLGYSIPYNSLGYGVFLAHHGSCIINGANHIGNYCALMNNVCIADSNPKTIGNGIYFATNVVVAGKTNIADGVKISACSFVNKSIDIRLSLWGGVPAKFLKNTEFWYYEEPYFTRYKQIELLKKQYFVRK